jgi:hypothetical protein
MNTSNIPAIIKDGKRLVLRHHASLCSGRSPSLINRLIGLGKIELHLIDAQLYIDLDETLAVLEPYRRTHRVDLFS